MSPGRVSRNINDYCFPRVSGDEPPELEGCYYMNVFSPRERG